ncbi:pyridoxal phosphate-dependent aminotransferase [Roseomonas sp. CCTCC AB2023176]|uniref:pyridoxal phosphate-dependent aminotransferase n=1 Tax=Roseomonas sp. CCTCC AB2023176 TaxID=3342640 RepID=UPI0035E16191
MPRPLAGRVAGLRPSATVEMTERVRAARAAGRRILALNSGDPGIPTDPRIVEAAHRAILAGDTRYAPAPGVPALREALAARENARARSAYGEGDILVTPGGKFALLAALMGTVEAGNEVIVPAPGWVSYEPCVRLCGGVPVALPMLDRVDPERLAAVVTPRTVAIILNSPVNPTGRTIGAEDLAAVMAVAERHDLWVIFDQVYADLVHAPSFARPHATPAGQARTFVVDSFSKTFGMTGWRLGFLGMPPGTAKAVQRFMQHSVYCVPGFVQAAGLAALALEAELVPGTRARFRARQLRAAERLSAIPGIACIAPDASFYLFPRVDADDRLVAARWLEDLDVSTLPGSAFGAAGTGHLRISVTAPEADIEEALDRIARAGLPVASAA